MKLDYYMQSGWLSDRAAAYMALGRSVITEPTNAETYLPPESRFLSLRPWRRLSGLYSASEKTETAYRGSARDCAVECFESTETRHHGRSRSAGRHKL